MTLARAVRWAALLSAVGIGSLANAAAGSYAVSDLGEFASFDDCVTAAQAAFGATLTSEAARTQVFDERVVFQSALGPEELDALIVCTPRGEGARAFLTVLSDKEGAAALHDTLAEHFSD